MLRCNKRMFFRVVVLGVFMVGLLFSSSLCAQQRDTEITFWDMDWSDPTHMSFQFFVPWFENYQGNIIPGVKISDDHGPGNAADLVRQYLIQAKTGVPDIATDRTENIANYTKMGLVQPLSQWFDAWEEKSQFPESVISALTVDGELMALPYNVHARALLYRKDIFAQLGLNVPQTWDEMINIGSKITANVPGMVGFGLSCKKYDPKGFQ